MYVLYSILPIVYAYNMYFDRIRKYCLSFSSGLKKIILTFLTWKFWVKKWIWTTHSGPRCGNRAKKFFSKIPNSLVDSWSWIISPFTVNIWGHLSDSNIKNFIYEHVVPAKSRYNPCKLMQDRKSIIIFWNWVEGISWVDYFTENEYNN